MRHAILAGLVGGALLLGGCTTPFAAAATPTPVATATVVPYPAAERSRFFASCGDNTGCACAWTYVQAHYSYAQFLTLTEAGSMRPGQPEFDAIVKACR